MPLQQGNQRPDDAEQSLKVVSCCRVRQNKILKLEKEVHELQETKATLLADAKADEVGLQAYSLKVRRLVADLRKSREETLAMRDEKLDVEQELYAMENAAKECELLKTDIQHLEEQVKTLQKKLDARPEPLPTQNPKPEPAKVSSSVSSGPVPGLEIFSRGKPRQTSEDEIAVLKKNLEISRGCVIYSEDRYDALQEVHQSLVREHTKSEDENTRLKEMNRKLGKAIMDLRRDNKKLKEAGASVRLEQ